jgi:cytochrome P450
MLRAMTTSSLPDPLRASAARCPHATAHAMPIATDGSPPSTHGPAPGASPWRTWWDLPGPSRRWWGLPLLREMWRDYLGFTERLRREHGDLVAMRIGTERSVDIFDPEGVREVLVQQADRTIRWERGVEVFGESFGQSVLVTEGPVWHRQRRMLQPAFTPRRVAEQAKAMTATIESALVGLDAAAQGGDDVDLEAFFSSVTVRVILRTLFGPEAEADTAAAAWATQVLSRTAMREMFMPMTLPDWLPLPGKADKRRALRTLREIVGRQVAARSRPGADQSSHADDAATPRDVLGLLLSLRDTDGPDATGAPLSPQEVFDQCIVTFQAGHETTATALSWWGRLLAEHADAMQKAQAEVDAVLHGRAPTADDLPRLPWLTATLKEAMRLYPPAAALLTRRATSDIVVRGTHLPKGTLLRITPWAVQRDPRLFDDPAAFRPERFMPGAPPPARGAWLPFGTGPRVCIGQHFAMLEATLVAAMLLQRFGWQLAAGMGPAQPEMNVTLRDRAGLRVRLLPRDTASLDRRSTAP